MTTYLIRQAETTYTLPSRAQMSYIYTQHFCNRVRSFWVEFNLHRYCSCLFISVSVLGAVVVVIIGHLVLQLPVQSMPINTKVVSSNPAHSEVYSIQNYVIKLVSDLRQVSGFALSLEIQLSYGNGIPWIGLTSLSFCVCAKTCEFFALLILVELLDINHCLYFRLINKDLIVGIS